MARGLLGRIHGRTSNGKTSRPHTPLPHAVRRRLREHLDASLILRTAAEEIQRALLSTRASLWLTTGAGAPTLAAAVGPAPRPMPPAAVIQCARREVPVRDPRGRILAVPISAPRSGLLGVACVEGVRGDSSEEAVLEALADETGFALETANLYEQAVAQRDRSEAILARVGDAVVVTDVQGRILGWNPAAERTVGCRAEEARGGWCTDVLGLHVGQRRLDCSGRCGLLDERTRAGSELGVEVWRPAADGRRQPFLADVSAVTDAEGHIAEIVHSLRDVTQLKEADEAKTMFLATASHELRTPLTVIQGFGQTLLAMPDWDPERRREALEAMVRRTLELNKIVDRLLLSSSIEGGRAAVKLTDLDIEPILRERTEALAGATGRVIERHVDDDLPWIRGDRDAITVVVDHLLDNAVKYSPDGGSIVVRATADASWVVLTITDQGVGMDAEQAARCFDKFWQADSSDDRRFGGTGIGLFIVRSLVEAMDGAVSVSSVPERGSTFRISLHRAFASKPSQRGGPTPGAGERTVIREFMRQLGIPAREAP
jgi:PAS domain S-box-containing protein